MLLWLVSNDTHTLTHTHRNMQHQHEHTDTYVDVHQSAHAHKPPSGSTVSHSVDRQGRGHSKAK